MCENEHCHIDLLSNEVLQQLVSYLDAKSAVHVCRTCSRLSSLTKFCDTLWKGLIKEDFEVKLHSRAPFMSYYDIYRLLFMSRFILKVYLSERYYFSGRFGALPGWLWTWVVLNSSAPTMPRWIFAHREPYVRVKFSEIPLGRITRTWGLKAIDMAVCNAIRSNRGTAYYTWFDIHRIALRKHGGRRGLLEFCLKRCARARRYVERTFEHLRQSSTSGRPISETSTGRTQFASCTLTHFFRPHPPL